MHNLGIKFIVNINITINYITIKNRAIPIKFLMRYSFLVSKVYFIFN